MKMVSMKLSRKEAEASSPKAMDDNLPEYPYGTRISLEKDQIEKLGLGTPKAGAELMLMARVEVKTVTTSDQADGKGYQSMELQITDMALSAPGVDHKAIAKALYGGKE